MHMVVNYILDGIEVSICVEKKVRIQNLNCGAGLKRGGGLIPHMCHNYGNLQHKLVTILQQIPKHGPRFQKVLKHGSVL